MALWVWYLTLTSTRLVRRYTLVFPWVQDHWRKNLDGTPTNLPSIWIQWAMSSVFHRYGHLATIFVPSIRLENVISHIEALAKFTQRALNDSNQAICLLNSEVPMMRKRCLTKSYGPWYSYSISRGHLC